MIKEASAHAPTAIDMTEIAIAEAPRPIPRVDLNRQHVEDVGERQPYGADLLPAGHQAVEDAARDDEVGARIVMRSARGQPVSSRTAAAGARDGRRDGNQQRRAGEGGLAAFVGNGARRSGQSVF